MRGQLQRRDFLRHSAAAGGAAMAVGYFTSSEAKAASSPNEKLNIAYIGTAAQAGFNIGGTRHENIVAICDIDDLLLGKASESFPKAQKYADFRLLLEQKDINAVVISTPDHTHAPAAVGALKLGKHVYCEKPLTHNVYEARLVAQTAAQAKVATQMGTQIHAGNNYRRAVEIVQSGAIGSVAEVHVFVATKYGGGERPTEKPEVPKHLHWDLWLGPAPERPYHPVYQPFTWRNWWDFGGGTLADMACHFMDLPFWALKLRHPTTVAASGPPAHPETATPGIRVDYEFPARGDLPAVKLTWYDGSMVPSELHGHKMPGNGVLFVGSKGKLFADYSNYKLLPESDFAGFKPLEPTIPNSIGHHAEWLLACKTGSPTTCNFDYAGALTEAVLLGTVSYRVGQKLEWDPAALKATNCAAAEQYLRREYRKGWAP